jgi:hypothetical protein
MPKALRLPTLLLISASFVFSQANSGQQGTVAAPGATPAAHDPAQPQKQMPPDTHAPAPNGVPGTQPALEQVNPTPTVAAGHISAGTTIRASLDTPLTTKTSRVGDRFTATVTAPVVDSNGNQIVPIGSKLNGQITEPSDEKVASAIKGMGHLNLRFTNLQLPNGTDIPINATLLSVHKAQLAQPSGNSNSQPKSTAIGGNTALTRAFGPPMKGVAVGNQSGGGYVLSTSGKQVELPADCGLRLRVDRDTSVR